MIGGHPCYDPKKDLVIPNFKEPNQIGESPLLGFPALPRKTLLFFRGDFRDDGFIQRYSNTKYSGFVRQKLHYISRLYRWDKKYNILIGSRKEIPGDYNDHLLNSRFCLVLPGDGHSPRAEDAILHGCIPVVIMDHVDPVFNNVLDWDSFALRVQQRDMLKLPDILLAITDERVAELQAALRNVWARFSYASAPLFREKVAGLQSLGEFTRKAQERAVRANVTIPDVSLSPGPHVGSIFEDDAFTTIMGFLYGRMLRQSRGAASASGGKSS
eukprot:jgi/Botrbrau1/5812/Bobra.0155s0034.1